MATVNEIGMNYNCTAIGDTSFDYGMLSKKTLLKIEEIEHFITDTLKNQNIGAQKRRQVILIESCLFKLQNVLYHLHNIKCNKERILSDLEEQLKNKYVPEFTIGLLERELVFEFEALLLQARACLDAITVLVTRDLSGQRTNFFTKLKKAIENSKMDKSISEKIIQLLNESTWVFKSDVLIGNSPTRSYVAHEGSLLTMQECCMTISGIGDRKLLLFDLEFRKSIPVMNTSSKILEDIPYIVINIMSMLCGLTPLGKKEFYNDLGNEFIILSKETVDSNESIKVGIIKEMNSVNIIINDCYISKSALSKAITFP
ncbi:MAG: hypothetical protein KAT05_09040 [Spirochaetes bacterium]|nr:hypothetical protein [Spirochaetota bacterium]